ncbi:MAG: hypothetical protein IT446_05670 [Phycisphaerales bacterium]|nr:hypothetical protein [Phycisphaerales bacterium]
MTLTARTLNQLRSEGWTCQTVEQWIPRLNIRRDLWRVGDVLAMREDSPVLLVQCTSGSNVAARIAKARAEPRLRTWLTCGQRFEIGGWSKRGKGRKRWQLRKVTISILGDELSIKENP